jgi:FGGY-family pentulose kinase
VTADRVVLGVDVGSTSARAGLFDATGHLIASAAAPFEIGRPAPHHAEHASDGIWQAVAQAVREARERAGVGAAQVVGLAFDATCSLVMLDQNGRPATVSVTGEDRWNVVMWADHRATAEAQEITATGHRVLDHVGGVMSPEMQLPKLLWLRRRLPDAWARHGRALDLADFLAWRATGTQAASECTLTCKWTYLNHETPGWQPDLFARLGLADLAERLPPRVLPVGARAGGLTDQAARDLGLLPGTKVGVGLIDAHAGGLGLLGAVPPDAINRHLALIAGTSNCHMACSPDPRRVPGIWGPYLGAMIPGLWLNEGGQSATGALLDHVLDSHAQATRLGQALTETNRHAEMAGHIQRALARQGPDFAAGLIVIPDFNGNRSPLADAARRGVMHGLELDASFDGLVRLYHATAVGIAYGTRHVVDALDQAGYAIRHVHMTGGHARSPYLAQLYADALGREIVLPAEPDAVLLGTAMVAAAAAGLHRDLAAACAAMARPGARLLPDGATAARHAKGYRAFRSLLEWRAPVA